MRITTKTTTARTTTDRPAPADHESIFVVVERCSSGCHLFQVVGTSHTAEGARRLIATHAALSGKSPDRFDYEEHTIHE